MAGRPAKARSSSVGSFLTLLTLFFPTSRCVVEQACGKGLVSGPAGWQRSLVSLLLQKQRSRKSTLLHTFLRQGTCLGAPQVQCRQLWRTTTVLWQREGSPQIRIGGYKSLHLFAALISSSLSDLSGFASAVPPAACLYCLLVSDSTSGKYFALDDISASQYTGRLPQAFAHAL